MVPSMAALLCWSSSRGRGVVVQPELGWLFNQGWPQPSQCLGKKYQKLEIAPFPRIGKQPPSSSLPI